MLRSQRSQSFDSKYLERDRYENRPHCREDFIESGHAFNFDWHCQINLTLDDLEGSKIKVILFDVKR